MIREPLRHIWSKSFSRGEMFKNASCRTDTDYISSMKMSRGSSEERVLNPDVAKIRCFTEVRATSPTTFSEG